MSFFFFFACYLKGFLSFDSGAFAHTAKLIRLSIQTSPAYIFPLVVTLGTGKRSVWHYMPQGGTLLERLYSSMERVHSLCVTMPAGFCSRWLSRYWLRKCSLRFYRYCPLISGMFPYHTPKLSDCFPELVRLCHGESADLFVHDQKHDVLLLCRVRLVGNEILLHDRYFMLLQSVIPHLLIPEIDIGLVLNQAVNGVHILIGAETHDGVGE